MRGTIHDSKRAPPDPRGGSAENQPPPGPEISPPYVFRARPPKRSNVTPMSRRISTACGATPSPHVLSRGKRLRSRRSTSTPEHASVCAAAAPAGPAPTTMTSAAIANGADLCDDGVDFFDGVVEMRTDPDAGARAVVHDEFPLDQLCARGLCPWKIHADVPAALGGIA